MYKAADHMKEESIDEKMNAGLQAYIDKKKGKKTDDKEENGNGKNGKASKGSKPDFLDLDGDGNKTEPMKSASKSKKSVKEGSAYGIYKGDGVPRMQKGAMAYDGPNKPASEAKDRILAKTKAKRAAMKEAMVVTNADKKGNTPAYQNFKKGMKSKTTGKPMYKAADHMKEEEIHPDDNALSPEELEKVAQLSRDWDAKMEEGYGGKPMMSKGGEVKPPRTAKGAMAYDGPNKAASEARDRLVAKTKAMREKK